MRVRDGGSGVIALCLGLTAAASIAAWGIAAANAHSYKLGDIAVGHVWAPPPENGVDGMAVYGPVLNRGNTAVRLVGAGSPAAAQARLRRKKSGVDHWPDAIELAPGKPLALAAWREHIWLSGLTRLLTEGDSFDLTLDFGDAGSLTVTVVVEKGSGH